MIIRYLRRGTYRTEIVVYPRQLLNPKKNRSMIGRTVSWCTVGEAAEPSAGNLRPNTRDDPAKRSTLVNTLKRPQDY